MKIDEEKLYQAYYEPDHLRADGKAIKKLHKITSMSKKDIKSWLGKLRHSSVIMSQNLKTK